MRSADNRSSHSRTTRDPRCCVSGSTNTHSRLGRSARTMVSRVSPMATCWPRAPFRRGITDTFTAEVHGETQVDGASALGLDTAWQVGTLGVVTLTAAAGTDREDSGWLAGLGVEHSGRRFDLFARTQLASERFVQIGRSAFEPRPKQRNFAGVGVDLERLGSLQFAYGQQSYWDADERGDGGGQLFAVTAQLRIRQPVCESRPVGRARRPMSFWAGPCPWVIGAPSARACRTVPTSRSVTASRRRPRCSRTCRPARVPATT